MGRLGSPGPMVAPGMPRGCGFPTRLNTAASHRPGVSRIPFRIARGIPEPRDLTGLSGSYHFRMMRNTTARAALVSVFVLAAMASTGCQNRDSAKPAADELSEAIERPVGDTQVTGANGIRVDDDDIANDIEPGEAAAVRNVDNVQAMADKGIEYGEAEKGEAEAFEATRSARWAEIKKSAEAAAGDPAKTCERVLSAAITCRNVARFRTAMAGKLGSLDELTFHVDTCPRWVSEGKTVGGPDWQDADVRKTLVEASLKAVNGPVEEVCPAFGSTLAEAGGMPTGAR